ncbi:MAG: hypothetical protein HKL92_01915 [Candidatus Eremiobacteraeota bacterium]|nr:hypothetical protein [Candidatus Eremiobacteraeota bacterium]
MTLRFSAGSGVLPTVKVSIAVRGPLDALDVQLTSEPSFPREQILPPIAPSGGVIGSPQLLNNTFSAGSNTLFYGTALPVGVALNGTNGFSFTLEWRP